MRAFAVLIGLTLAVGGVLPAQAEGFKPKIRYVRATDDNEGIRFTAKVRMDKGHLQGADRVRITYDGVRKTARRLDDPPLSFYETGPYAAPVRNCYRVTVRARNQDGVRTKTLRAGLLGTDGCS